jgi:hypothetical protein
MRLGTGYTLRIRASVCFMCMALKKLGMVAHLKRDGALVVLRRVGHDIGEIAVHGQQNRVYFQSLGDNNRIRRLHRQNILQTHNLKRKRDFITHKERA